MKHDTIEKIQILRKQTGAGIVDCKKAWNEANGDIETALELLKGKGEQIAVKKAQRVALDGLIHSEVIGDTAVIVEVSSETDFVSNTEEFAENTKLIARIIAEQKPKDIQELLELIVHAQSITVSGLIQNMTLRFREKIEVKRFDWIAGNQPYSYLHSNTMYGTTNNRFGVILNLDTSLADCETIDMLKKELALQMIAMAPKYISRTHIPLEVRKEIEEGVIQEIENDSKLVGKPKPVLDNIYHGKMEKYFQKYCLLEQPYIKNDDMTVNDFLITFDSDIQITDFYVYEKEKSEGDEKLQYAQSLNKA